MKRKTLTKNKTSFKPKRVANIYGEGTSSRKVAEKAFSAENLGSSLGTIGGAVGDITTAALANAEVDTSKADNAIQAINNYQPNLSSLDALAESYNNASIAPTDFNHKDFMVSTGEGLANMGKAALSGASAGATVGGPWGCVCAGTRVLTKEGIFKNIEDLKENDGILGYFDKTAKQESIKLCEGEAFKECVKIELESGNYIECSIDHPIYLSRQHERQHKKIDGKDRKYRKYKYVNASECNIGDSVAVIREIPYFGNHHEDNAYLIGLLIGDGSYGKNKGGRLHTGDKNTWDYIETNNLGYICEDHTKNDKYSKEFRTYRIHNASKLLSAYGLYGQTKLNKTLPSNIQNWDKESLANLIAGLWDTDGYITVESKSKKHRICFTQSNLPLIKSLQEVLIRFGILSSVKINKSKVSYNGTHKINSKESYVLVIKDKISTTNFYNNIHLNIDYKQQNLNKCFELVSDKYCHDSSYFEGLKADKIVNIIPIGVRRIYNLEAKEYNNYIANFIVTHNSIIGGAVGLLGSGAGWIAGGVKAREAEEAKEREALAANAAARTKTLSARDKIITDSTNEFLKNIAAYGGPIFNHSGEFTNDVTFINEGGTHSQNPNQGVQLGVDNNNVPNLVEEGEVVFNDYVFSNRLKATKELLDTNGFSDKYTDWTFAKIAEELQKESSERPNDNISKNGLNDMMNRLITLQEVIRQNKAKNTNKFSTGGKVNILEDGTSDSDQPEDDETSFITYLPEVSNFSGGNSEDTHTVKGESSGITPPPSKGFNWQSLGRIAPTITHVGMAIANAAKKPDYSNAESIIEAANRIPLVRAPHIGGKQVYTPIDRNYMLTKHMNQSRSVAKDIQNNAITGTQALGHLANLSYNTQSGIGDALLAMDRENFARRMQIADFNRGVDQINAGLDMQGAGMNQHRGLAILDAETKAAMLREQIDAMRTSALSGNLSGIAEDLGNMGKEALDRQSREDLIRSGALRTASKKNGGMLTKKRRK